MTWRLAGRLTRRLAAALAMVLVQGPGPAWAADARWDRWQMLMWQDHTPAEMAGLARLGFTGAKLFGTGGRVDRQGAADRVGAGLSYYLENIATDFYAAYHRYTPGKPVTWLFDAVRARRLLAPGDPAVDRRTPSLSDPAWLEQVRRRLDAIVRASAADRPLFYNLGDETGIADLAAAWDFDQSPESLDAFRVWLRTQYADLPALNREWGTAYAGWDDVRPEPTDAAIRRTDENFAPWSDFKEWMDVAFARAVAAGRDAVHAADPGALAALEGGQLPGWGGYDYALLAPAVDAMEIYDTAESLDLAAAFNPALIPLRTSFGRGPREIHAAWHNVLHGGRGTVVWDEARDVVGADGVPGPRGLELQALARAITPVAAILNQGPPDPDAVAVLVSQASFRVTWLLDRRAGDHDWQARDAEREYDDNAWRASRRVMLQHLAAIGVQPRLASGAMLLQGLPGTKVLLLPHAVALSDAEVDAIEAFRVAGGTVLADTEPGLFDGHGRRRTVPPFPDVPHPEAVRPLGDAAAPGQLEALAGVLSAAGVPPRVRLQGFDGQAATGVEARWFRTPRGPVLALQTSQPQAGHVPLVLRFAARTSVLDLRGGADLGATDRLDVSLDGVEPTLLLLAAPP